MHTSAREGNDVCTVSVVVPCFNEAASLSEFHRRTSAACESVVGDDYEVIMVDDGSRDATWPVIEKLAATDARVVGVHLMRNHGHQLAATAGLAVSRGQRVMLIDADLQDPPELLSKMMELMDAGADVVYGKRASRAGENWFKITSATAFYEALARIVSVPIPTDTGDFRLMSRRVVDILLAMPERERFIRGMVSWIGGNQVPLSYARDPRTTGSSKYSLVMMINFAANAVTSFSIAPLRFSVWLGLFIACAAALLLTYTLVQWFNGNTVTGWTSIMTALCLFSGVQLLVLGILGEYVGRLLQESKGRPLYLIDTLLAAGQCHKLPPDFSRLSRADREKTVCMLRRPPRSEHVADGDTQSSLSATTARVDPPTQS
jgi:polyisoprenyl-phosphate glycosyltransferase